MTKTNFFESKIYGINLYPCNWKLGKFKNLCKIFSGGTPDTNNVLYWDGDIPWIQSGKLHYNNIYNGSKFITRLGLNNSSTKMIKKDTPLLAMTGATCGNVGFLKIEACANQSVMAFESNNNTCSRFIYYSLINSKDQILLLQSGGAQSGISTQDGMNLKLCFPSFCEQKKIADYLDKRCLKIDEIIRDNNKEIELLEEYKKRIIFQNTMFGKKIKVKNIGIVKGRIGFKGYSNDDIVDEETPGRALSIGGTNIMKSGKISYDKRTYISEKKYLESPEIMLKGGEILMTKVGAGCGDNSIYDYYEERVTINPNVMILLVRDKDTINSKYINYCLLNDEVRNNIKIESSSGGAQPAINQELLKNLKINLPSRSIQDKIVEYLDKQCSKLDEVVDYRKKIIAKLEEYKKSLIYECVTGKREV